MTERDHNNIVVMIEEFDANGSLPPGIHWTTWQEFTGRFGKTPHRRRLLAGLKQAIELLRRAGCTVIYVDGSFVTRKRQPRDFDACWDAEDVNTNFLFRLEPLFFDMTDKRAAQKARFGGEIFRAQTREVRTGKTFLNFFQTDQEDRPKGIVAIDLKRW